MKKTHYLINLITSYAITCLLVIFNMANCKNIKNILSEGYGYDFNENLSVLNPRWDIYIVIVGIIILLIASISLIIAVFSAYTQQRGLKITQLVFHYINIVLILTTITTYLVSEFQLYNNAYTMMIYEEVNSIPYEIKTILNYVYRQSILLLAFSSIPSLILSHTAIKHPVVIDTINTNQTTNNATTTDENEFMVEEIKKIKKQIELKNLKAEYEQLYKELTNTNNKENS